jgi:hypothetical protein
MVRGILSDANIQGHVQALVHVLEGPAWREVWDSLSLSLCVFRDLGLDRHVKDSDLWQKCQEEQVVLITANRNADGPDSLEATLRTRNMPESLPIFTLADPAQVLRSRDYAERVVERLLDYLLDIDKYRGTGRLYLP